MEKHALHQRIRNLRASSKHGASTQERNAFCSVAENLRTHIRHCICKRGRCPQHARRQKESLINRLIFSEEKLEASLSGLRQVAQLDDPIGKVKQRRLLDTGLLLEQVTFPIGVIGMIFEARPDALIQIVSLCLKSGNGIILKGGREAQRTNTALVEVIKQSCASSKLGDAWLTLLESHGDVDQILGMEEEIDLLIPRGTNQFVKYVRAHIDYRTRPCRWDLHLYIVRKLFGQGC